MQSYDLVVIGSGPAGEKAAAKAAYFGKSVAVVEKEPELGGAGVHTGTAPSKTLKETSLFLSGKYDTGLYGVERSLQGRATVEHFLYRKNHVVRILNEAVRRNLDWHGVPLYQGTASFVDSHRIRISRSDNRTVEISGRFILIATGSYPYHPPGIEFDGESLHDSDSILRIKTIPKRICIVGAGVIGCEYATIFSTLGAQVVLVNGHSAILPFLDGEIAGELIAQMEKDGIELKFNARVDSVDTIRGSQSLIRARLSSGETVEADMFLQAAGRCGNIASLQCERAGVETGPRETVIVDEHYRTNIPHIYAAGDVIGFPALASASMDQGRVAVAHMFELTDLEYISEHIPYGIYTVPEVSMVGLSEEAAQREGIDCCVGRARFGDMTRGMIMGVKEGILKLVFRRSDNVVVGVHIIGPIATELIHFGMKVVERGETLDALISTVFNYPTLHDLYKYAAYDGLGNKSGRKLRR